MLATVDITVKAPNMFSATRHAQRLAGNFLEDVDDFQRASRAADRRAMSHFDEATGTTFYTRPVRSLSMSRVTTIPSDYYIEGPRIRSSSVEPRYTYTTLTRPVTVVGSRYYTPSPYYYRFHPRFYAYDTYYPTYSYYDYPLYTKSVYKYWPYTTGSHYSHYLPSTNYGVRSNTSIYDYSLPTSGLRASVPSWDIGYRPLSLSRWYSHSDLVDSSVYPSSPIYEPPPRRFRYRSVPPVSPAAAAQYRRAGSIARVSRPIRYYSEYYSDLTEPTPISTKYVSHSLMGLPPKPFYRPIPRYVRLPNGPKTDLDRQITSEVMAERRRIDRKLDDLLSYKLPDASIYDGLKSSLRKVHDKMDVHRTLLDRYSAIDMKDGNISVEDRISSKYQEIGERMAR
ncbi:hypothetical protein Aperf_G00000091100 [Anoplocephala perfoliata]